MAKELKRGDKVEWGTSQGKTKGVVKKKVTSPMKIKGHQVKASKENPEYLVESSKTGEKAAHKAEALKKTSSSAKKTSKKSTSKKSSSSNSAKKKSSTAKKTTSTKKSGSIAKKAAKKTTAKKKTGGSTSAKTSKPASTAKKTSKSKDDDDQVMKEFKDLVNMAPKALEKWLGTKESKKVGFKDGGRANRSGMNRERRF